MPPLADGFRAMWRSGAARNLAGGVTVTSLIGYGHAAFGPSFLQRSLGLSITEVALYVAPVGAVMGTASAVGGGWLANRLAVAHGLHAQAWMVLVLKSVGLPLSFAFYLSGDPWVAVPLYWGSLLLTQTYLGPTYALIQGLAPLRMRALWAAILLLVINLVGLGLGPTLIGVLSDLFRPAHGEESLRYAMLCYAAATPLALWFYWRAGVLLKRRGA